MTDDTIRCVTQALKWASQNGLLHEFVKDFLEHATCGSHTGDQEIKEAIVYANREWDL